MGRVGRSLHGQATHSAVTDWWTAAPPGRGPGLALQSRPADWDWAGLETEFPSCQPGLSRDWGLGSRLDAVISGKKSHFDP